LQSKNKENIQKAWDNFQLNDSIQKLIIVHNDVVELWENFKGIFREVPAAGGLVLNENQEVLMIFRRGKWDLPKGKLEKDEKIKDCAVREVEEECGLKDVKRGKKICTTHHIYSLNDKPSIKPSYWFLMTVKGRPKLTPQKEEGIVKAKWIPLNKVNELLPEAFPSIKEVFKAYRKLVNT